jgi:TetR/AcrR family transcriptional regulator, transcriptional repressor for nem operon
MRSSYPSKREITNKLIIEKAAELFNRKGYAGTSISDIMEATGLEKGGIYGHFKSKREISIAAFEYNAMRVFESFDVNYLSDKSTIEKLHVLFSYIERMYDEPYLSGGCPLLNTATEADDTDAELLFLVRKYLDRLKEAICEIVKNGIKLKEVQQDVDSDELAVACIEILEGGNFLVKVYNDKSYRKRAIVRIKALIDSELRR